MLVKEAIAPDRPISADEFERILDLPENQDRLLELVHGRVVEKMPTEEHGVIASTLSFALFAYNRQHKVGRVGVEVRQRLPHDQLNSRMPDISFSSARRPIVRRGGVPEMPDLAVEIKSPDDSVRQMREKAAYYLANGARLVWLIYPQKRLIEVYDPDAEVEILIEGDVLTGRDLLPGFILPVAEVFADPLAE